MTAQPPRVLALVGPTAAGKSALALAAAERLGAEIVAVDAFTVYRGMDIGTAKPTPQERARVPHHLVDVLDPAEDSTVAWFQGAARAAIADVLARGRLPLLVGGSGLYFRAVVDPLEFPPTDPGVRADLEARWACDPPGAHASLAARDPAAAAAIDPGNLRRTVRALEVLALSGRPFSDWRRAWDTHDSVYPGLRVVGVDVDRPALAARIDARVDAMLASGLVDECARLARGALSVTARQAIGYAELFEHLEGRVDLPEAVRRTKIRTRRFAVRQTRWFAADPRVGWRTPADIVEVLIACAS
jgi:tRNA dimethylallyltransferase